MSKEDTNRAAKQSEEALRAAKDAGQLDTPTEAAPAHGAPIEPPLVYEKPVALNPYYEPALRYARDMEKLKDPRQWGRPSRLDSPICPVCSALVDHIDTHIEWHSHQKPTMIG